MDREQIYEAFDNGLIGLDDIIDISQKDGYNQALEDFKSKWINRINEAYKSQNTVNVLCTMCNNIIEELKR